MLTERLNFPAIISENEQTYLNYIEGLVSSVDVDAAILFTRVGEGIRVRVSPSTYEKLSSILTEIKKFHTMINIRVDFSKSIKSGGNISYLIDF